VQTEDSGIGHPHVITHLFMDGGRILKSSKTSYAEHVGADGMRETVKGMMKEQHKAMLIALRDGQFDALLDGGKPATAPSPSQPSFDAPPPEPSPSSPAVPVSTDAPPTDASPAFTDASDASDATAVAAAPAASEAPSSPSVDSGGRSDTFLDNGDASERTLVDTRVLPPEEPSAPAPAAAAAAADKPAEVRRPSAHELTLDFDALSRDDGALSSSLFRRSDLPPPPTNLFTGRKKDSSASTYRTKDVETKPEQPAPAPAAVLRRPTPADSPQRASSGEGRYAPARPAAIFGASAKPPKRPSLRPSIQQDDLVTDKSLDEVILSYLAEDLDPPPRRK
jgi:hypothetical protein